MVAAQSGKMYVIHYFTEISANLRLMQFFLLRILSSTITRDKIYNVKWSWNLMAVILKVPSDHYYIQGVLDPASCEIFTRNNTSY